jgi:hypothetical protein
MKLIGYVINVFIVVTRPYKNPTIFFVLIGVTALYYIMRLKFKFYNLNTQFLFSSMYASVLAVLISNTINYYIIFSFYFELLFLCVFLSINYFLNSILESNIFKELGEV